ncbi:hypothetical Protein YC6258_05510 [Gynuella sunshinyii YC6258]|uniref:Uncharacterized protein n=1 Tax=Gynuella sunshinyii YC6258 TaxID=1445510 RepID=A0A0C5VW32_9GAMM|nr:hypothetical Protein YC6258_05510 [Gynuella sunshinyii YC6258]
MFVLFCQVTSGELFLCPMRFNRAFFCRSTSQKSKVFLLPFF